MDGSNKSFINPYKRKRLNPSNPVQSFPSQQHCVMSSRSSDPVLASLSTNQFVESNTSPSSDLYTSTYKNDNITTSIVSGVAKYSDLDHGFSESLSHNKADEFATSNDNAPATDVKIGSSTISDSASALVISAANKAGMDGIDREAIDRIILQESGNSLFMQQQVRRDEKVNQKIEQLRQKLQYQDKMDPNWRHSVQKSIDRDEVPKLLSARPIRSCKVVVDMDMFYMACELLSRPDLAAVNDQQPACVGGIGMLCTSNYAARRYGVRAGMPGYIAQKLVEKLSNGEKSLVFCKMNFPLYHEKSSQVMDVLREYDPFHMKSYSLDEAFMDIGPYLACKLHLLSQNKLYDHQQVSETLRIVYLNRCTEDKNDDLDQPTMQQQKKSESCQRESEIDWSDCNTVDEILLGYPRQQCLDVASEILQEMRRHVHRVSSLTCSAGLAANFLLAKIASDVNKPNGQMIIDSDHDVITKFLHPLSIRKINGIGRVTEKILKSFDVVTVRDLYEKRALVRFLFQTNSSKDSQAGFLLNASLGCSSSDASEPDDGEDNSNEDGLSQKGISKERTFPSGKSWTEINSKMEDIARLLSKDMQRKDLWAHTVTVKVKLHTFDVFTRARTMPDGVFVQPPADLVRISTELLQEVKMEYIENERKKKRNSNSKHVMFSVRLVGIRCNNFRANDDTASSSNQRTIKMYLRGANEENSIATPSTESLTSPTIVTNNFNPYARNRKRTENESLHGKDLFSDVNTCDLNSDRNDFGSGPSMPINLVESDTMQRNQLDEAINLSNDVVCEPPKHFVCPVCLTNLRISLNNHISINEHLDMCLSGKSVGQNGNKETATSINKRKNKNLPTGRSLLDYLKAT